MLRRIVTALVLILAVLGVVLYAPPWLFLLVVSLFALLSLWEYLGILTASGLQAFPILYPLMLGLPWLWFYLPEARLWYLIACFFSIALWTVLRTRALERGLASAGAGLAGLWWIGLPFALVSEFHALARFPGDSPSPLPDHSRPVELLVVLATVWACDSGAYFIGKAFGKRRITPRLSPGKTLEGFIASLLSAVGAFWLFSFVWISSFSTSKQLLAGLVIGVAALCGDLFESLIKRGAGVKDTSRLIPGHGGVLDRIDSMLLAVPAYYLLTRLL